MPIERGTVVLCLAGKEKGSLAAVVCGGDTAVLIADGRRRPCEKPKTKNIRHISATGQTLGEADMATNKRLRKALNAIAAANQ